MARHTDTSLIQFLVVIGFALLTALYNWFKKKQEAKGQQETWTDEPPRSTPPGGGRPPIKQPVSAPPPKSVSWEEELRRLLEGNQPAAPSPPPVIVREAPRRPPPLPAAPAPVVPRPVVVRQTPLVMRPVDEQDIGLPVNLPGLTQSARAYQTASQLDVKMAEHLRQVDERVSRHKTAAIVRAVSPDVARAMGLLRTPHALRSAVIAYAILGPPKALEIQA